MRRSKLFIGVAAAALACASGAAFAGGHVGVYIGAGPWPYYYPVVPAPYYYGPAPVVVAPPAPQAPDYVEQGQAQQGPAEQEAGPTEGGDTWYYCDASKTYYPYVKQCPSGWREVPAQAAPAN